MADINNVVPIVLTCLLIVLTTVAYFILTAKKSSSKKTKKREPAIFITGPSRSGKTALFTLVCFHELINMI